MSFTEKKERLLRKELNKLIQEGAIVHNAALQLEDVGKKLSYLNVKYGMLNQVVQKIIQYFRDEQDLVKREPAYLDSLKRSEHELTKIMDDLKQESVQTLGQMKKSEKLWKHLVKDEEHLSKLAGDLNKIDREAEKKNLKKMKDEEDIEKSVISIFRKATVEIHKHIKHLVNEYTSDKKSGELIQTFNESLGLTSDNTGTIKKIQEPVNQLTHMTQEILHDIDEEKKRHEEMLEGVHA